MAEPFKELLNADVVRAAAAQLARHAPGFDEQGFARHAAKGLEGLELKARAMHIASALQATLPPRFADAAALIEAALAPVDPGDAMPQRAGLDAVRPITTRRYCAGRHRVVVQVNGHEVAEAWFDLALA